MVSLFNWFVKITGAIPQHFAIGLKTYYEDKKVQNKKIKGKAIVISNHHALFDFAAMMFLFWRRTLRCVVAEVIYAKNALMRLFLRALGCIKVDRNDYDFAFVGKAKKILDKGGVVEIFPEARLNNKGEEPLLEFKPSYVYLALESNAPIIPVYIKPRYFKKGKSRVIIGKPVDLCELYDSALTEKENIKNLNDYMKGKILELKSNLERQIDEEKAKKA